MDIDKLKKAVAKGYIEWQRHALERMLQRGISRAIVKKVILSGELIEQYHDDRPFPSGLFLGWVESEPFHVVVAFDIEKGYSFVITAYRPDLEHFETDYKTRRSQDG